MNATFTRQAAPDPSLSREQLLVARLRDGDEAAAEALVRLHGGSMLRVARRYMRCDQDAADVVQDAFLSAFKALGSFSFDSQLATWLHRITVNAALMKLRARSRRPECSLDGLPAFDADGSHAGAVPEWSRDALDRVATREIRLQVRACIDQLPESYRTVLVLRDIEERDTAEVASLLSCSVANVKTRLHRARQALRGLLTPIFIEAM